MRIVLIGAGGHGRVCAEIAELLGYDDILFLDDDRGRKVCGKYGVVGTTGDFYQFVNDSTRFFVAIGNTDMRRKMQRQIYNAGGWITILVHPDAVVSKEAELGTGTVVMAGAIINVGAVIGKGVIVNTSSSIDHDCQVGDYCHVAVGAHLCGSVAVGNCTWIGAGAVVSNDVDICGKCIIGAGAVVVENIEEAGKYIGVPVRKK